MSETIELAERLDTAVAVELHTTLSGMPDGSSVCLDAKNVTHFGAQVLQVVLAARKKFEASAGTLHCINLNERAFAQIAAMGFAQSDFMEAQDDA